MLDSYHNFAKSLREFTRIFSRILPESCQDLARTLPGYYQTSAKDFASILAGFAMILSEYRQRIGKRVRTRAIKTAWKRARGSERVREKARRNDKNDYERMSANAHVLLFSHQFLGLPFQVVVVVVVSRRLF